MSLQDLEAQRHRLRRLRILQTLYMGRPNPMGDGLILQALKGDYDLSFSQSIVRNALDYLEDVNLVQLLKRESDLWVAKISSNGIDYLDGLSDPLPGVAQPGDF
ncbi:MAG: hypothetical protein DHS20C12_11850 [Pseudohongiella sp.]|nr:MAG: hypothetical protein DHS20C12_11850 [Pseudohongiella sp.]